MNKRSNGPATAMQPAAVARRLSGVRRAWLIWLLFCIEGIPSACAGPGPVSLKKEKVTELRLIVNESELRIPGGKFRIGVVATLASGRQAATTGLAGGVLKWKDFTVEVSGVQHRNGLVQIPDEPVRADSTLTLHVISKSSPPVEITQTLPLHRPKSMALVPLESFRKAPGHRFRVGIEVRYDNGQSVLVGDKLDRFLQLYRLQADSKGGAFQNGRFDIYSDPRWIGAHEVSLTLRSPVLTDLAGEMRFRLDYIDHYEWTAKARDGMSGMSGTSGSGGSTGSSGSDGSDGRDGDSGEPGHSLEILADAYGDSILNCDLLRVKVRDLETGQSRFFLVNPNGGALRVTTTGGDGGNGGGGGGGGSGGSGEAGSTSDVRSVTGGIETTTAVPGAGGSGGRGGDGGRGGRGGDAGRGGDVVIRYTAAAEKYFSLIEVRCPAGSVGNGGSGGSGGGGGNGGSGFPAGSPGAGGASGGTGVSGSDAHEGQITREKVDAISW